MEEQCESGTFRFNNIDYYCPVQLTLNVIGGKWKILILWSLQTKTMRYSELRRALPKVTHKMLTQQLREMEADGLINRKVYPQVPPRVEYSLADEGERMLPVLDEMGKWGVKYMVRDETTELMGEET